MLHLSNIPAKLDRYGQSETHDNFTPTQRRMLELERLIAGECCDGWLLASLCAEYYDLSIKQEE